MLRHGRYKPAGRAKPASEFLLKAAGAVEFARICAPVDVNNAISLASGLPGSIFDAALCGPELLLRRGAASERYVFNPTGQTIELEDLLLVCRRATAGWAPCGNPVKDAMATKVRPETRALLAVLYVPVGLGRTFAERWTRSYAEWLERHCRPAGLGWFLGPGSSAS
jgi:DNA/RNA-binding domain of Phe-tRNA-synthetase-like protein